MLFIPEYVSVVIDDISHYRKIIRDGLYINGFKYVRLMCSAGQARVNTVILIREDFDAELKKRLRCGAKSVKITKKQIQCLLCSLIFCNLHNSTPECLSY